MIARPDQVGRLLEQLSAALPIPARVTPELQVLLREKNGITVPATCSVTWVSYAGDAGGTVCQLDAGAHTSRRAHLADAPEVRPPPASRPGHPHLPKASREAFAPPAAVNLRRHQRPKSSRFSRGAVATLTHVATAAAINFNRMAAWFGGRPIAPTRTSRFAALAA